MSKLTIKEAKSEGYIVDTCCYPPLAYKGARFRPTKTNDCFTELEGELLGALLRLSAAADEYSDITASRRGFAALTHAKAVVKKASE